MTKTREVAPPVQQGASTARTARKHLVLLADSAHAKAERSRRSWHLAGRANAPVVAAQIRRRVLKHQAIAHHLDAECRGCHEPR